MEDTKPEKVASNSCSRCDNTKSLDKFYRNSAICRDCHNISRREKYKNNEEHRQKLIKQASDFKHQKVIARQQKRHEEQLKLGIDNKQCRYCNEIKHKDSFRHNRLKCKDCERDEPIEKFKRYIRTRIYNCLRYKNKTKHSIEYLGCSSGEYFKWIFGYNNDCNMDNYGHGWHIDHVIPISKFDLNDEGQQLLAFNWRNTMPLSCKENLAKNNKIIKEQLALHYKKLLKFHEENNLDLPQEFIDLFAKHLDDGNPLKLSLPFTYGNTCEELSQ